MPKRAAPIDFGFDPAESPYHFVISIDTDAGQISISERFTWPDEEPNASAENGASAKATLNPDRWRRIATAAAETFNRRLAANKQPPGVWRTSGDTILAPYFGKEITLLFWAVEDADPTLIPNMLANWTGLAPEERWWLYTTINATSRYADFGKDRGWRKAIKIAFAENPAAAPPPSMLADYTPPVLPASASSAEACPQPKTSPAETGDEERTAHSTSISTGTSSRPRRQRRLWPAPSQITLPMPEDQTL
jgi:hypothetical protein